MESRSIVVATLPNDAFAHCFVVRREDGSGAVVRQSLANAALSEWTSADRRWTSVDWCVGHVTAAVALRGAVLARPPAWLSGGGGIRTPEGHDTPSDFRDRVEVAVLQVFLFPFASRFASSRGVGMQEELGLEPSPEVRRVERQVLAHGPSRRPFEGATPGAKDGNSRVGCVTRSRLVEPAELQAKPSLCTRPHAHAPAWVGGTSRHAAACRRSPLSPVRRARRSSRNRRSTSFPAPRRAYSS